MKKTGEEAYSEHLILDVSQHGTDRALHTPASSGASPRG